MILLFLLTACFGPAIESYIDQGTACLFAPDADSTAFWYGDTIPAQHYEEDQPVVVSVDFEASCLHMDCMEWWSTASIALDGDTLVITSDGETTDVAGSSCNDDCGTLGATATSEHLTAGSYTVVFGTAEATLEIPSTGTVCLSN